MIVRVGLIGLVPTGLIAQAAQTARGFPIDRIGPVVPTDLGGATAGFTIDRRGPTVQEPATSVIAGPVQVVQPTGWAIGSTVTPIATSGGTIGATTSAST